MHAIINSRDTDQVWIIQSIQFNTTDPDDVFLLPMSPSSEENSELRLLLTPDCPPTLSSCSSKFDIFNFK